MACVAFGKSSPFRYKVKKKYFFYIDAGHLDELSRVDHRQAGGGVGHDDTDAGSCRCVISTREIKEWVE